MCVPHLGQGKVLRAVDDVAGLGGLARPEKGARHRLADRELAAQNIQSVRGNTDHNRLA